MRLGGDAWRRVTQLGPAPDASYLIVATLAAVVRLGLIWFSPSSARRLCAISLRASPLAEGESNREKILTCLLTASLLVRLETNVDLRPPMLRLIGNLASFGDVLTAPALNPRHSIIPAPARRTTFHTSQVWPGIRGLTDRTVTDCCDASFSVTESRICCSSQFLQARKV